MDEILDNEFEREKARREYDLAFHEMERKLRELDWKQQKMERESIHQEKNDLLEYIDMTSNEFVSPYALDVYIARWIEYGSSVITKEMIRKALARVQPEEEKNVLLVRYSDYLF